MVPLARCILSTCQRTSQIVQLKYIFKTCNRHIINHSNLLSRRFQLTADFYKIIFVTRILNPYVQIFSLRNVCLRASKCLTKPFTRFMIAATAFSFNGGTIPEHELHHCSRVMESDFDLLPKLEEVPGEVTSTNKPNDWDLIIDQPLFKLYRRPLIDSNHLYEYKCLGRYYDVCANNFFRAQIDNDYRKKWDNLIIELDIVAIEQHSGSELVHWVSHFPFPMAPREYWFTRRACIDPCAKRMLIAHRSTDPMTHGIKVNNDKASTSCVRVDVYDSTMLIKPHSTFDELGVDFVLTYVDDPHAPFPTPAYKWLVAYGVPGYVQKVHDAAFRLDQDQNA